MHLFLLPGLDGGARLFGRFRAALPPPLTSEPVAYPPRERRSYGALEAQVRGRLAARPEPSALVAESFSGPLAIRIAADPPPHLRAIVLVASFADAPVPRWLEPLVSPAAFRLPPPRWALRTFLVGRDAPAALVDELREAIRTVDPAVLSARVRAAIRVDVRAELRRAPVPILALEGARDRLLRDRRALWRCRPSLRREVLDAPHLILQRRPREAARLVADFVHALR